MHQYQVQWDGNEVEVVPADDSSEVSLADMNAWDAEGQELISGIVLEDCDRIDDKKWTEAGLIHRPHRVNTTWHATRCNRIREAGPSDRPQKIEKSCLHCQSSISDISLRKQSKDRHWRILLQTGSALILLHYLFMLGLCCGWYCGFCCGWYCCCCCWYS